MTKAKPPPEAAGEEREKVGPGHPPKQFQFKPGNPGRQKGSRNKLGEAFIEALHDDFLVHGVTAIQTVREDRPHEYLKVVASLLPKQIEIKDDAFGDLSDDQLAAIITAARSSLEVHSEGGSGVGEAGKPEPSGKLPAVH